MVVCDSCEGREDVKRTRFIGNAIEHEADRSQIDAGRLDFVGASADLCIRCRNRLVRTIKEAVQPQPKCLNSKYSVVTLAASILVSTATTPRSWGLVGGDPRHLPTV